MNRLVVVVCMLALGACEKAGPSKRKDAGPPPPADAPPALAVDLVFAIDASKSMEEVDVPRDRFDAAQRAVQRDVARMTPRDRTGVVIYAQRPKLVTSLTTDIE